MKNYPILHGDYLTMLYRQQVVTKSRSSKQRKTKSAEIGSTMIVEDPARAVDTDEEQLSACRASVHRQRVSNVTSVLLSPDVVTAAARCRRNTPGNIERAAVSRPPAPAPLLFNDLVPAAAAQRGWFSTGFRV